jgi:hypothetical protein
MSDADRQLRQLAKHKDSTVRARATVLAELFASLEALQERAERAEHLLRAIAFDDQGKLQAWLQPLYIREPYVTVLVDKATQLLSPTQETDPE